MLSLLLDRLNSQFLHKAILMNFSEDPLIINSIDTNLTDRELLNQLLSLPNHILRSQYLSQARYSNLVLSLMPLLEDKTQSIRIVEIAWYVDQCLAARLAGAANHLIQEETVWRLRELIDKFIAIGYYGINVKTKLLAITASEWVIPDLSDLLHQSDYYPSVQALKIIASRKYLGNVGNVAILAEDALIKGLENPNSHVRRVTADVLGHIASNRAIPLLIKNLQEHPDSWVRAMAATSLGKIGNPDTLDALLMALRDPVHGVRECAAESLGLLKNNLAIEPLIVVLEDKHENVRSTAVLALGQLESDRTVEELIRLLRESHDNRILSKVAEALGTIGSELIVEPLIEALGYKHAWFSAWEKLCEALCAIGNERAISAVEFLLSQNHYACKIAINELVKTRSERSIQALFNAFNSGDRVLCDRIAFALPRDICKQRIDLLIITLKTGFTRVRGRSAEILGQTGDEKAIEPLMSALQDENSWVRQKAVISLAKIAGENAVNQLIEILKDRDSDVRKNACKALGFIHREEAIEPLIVALQDPSTRVRASAASALGNINSILAVHQLTILLQDPSDLVQRIAANTLGKIQSDLAIESLPNNLRQRYFQSVIKKKQQQQRVISRSTEEISDRFINEQILDNELNHILKLSNHLYYQYSKEQYKTVKILGKIGTAATLEPLLLFLNDNNSYILRRQTLDSLEKTISRLDRDTLLDKRDLIVEQLTVVLRDNLPQIHRDSVKDLLKKVGNIQQFDFDTH
jgi:HEAT repeat protein